MCRIQKGMEYCRITFKKVLIALFIIQHTAVKATDHIGIHFQQWLTWNGTFNVLNHLFLRPPQIGQIGYIFPILLPPASFTFIPRLHIRKSREVSRKLDTPRDSMTCLFPAVQVRVSAYPSPAKWSRRGFIRGFDLTSPCTFSTGT